MNNFLPSAVKFHYQFNLREMSNVAQGLCRMIKEYYKEPIKVGLPALGHCDLIAHPHMAARVLWKLIHPMQYIQCPCCDVHAGGAPVGARVRARVPRPHGQRGRHAEV